MAARTKKIRHDENTRDKIQCSQLINRLQDHVFGKIELSATQINAAQILLRKKLPDLNATTLSGDADNPIRHEHSAAREKLQALVARHVTSEDTGEDIPTTH